MLIKTLHVLSLQGQCFGFKADGPSRSLKAAGHYIVSKPVGGPWQVERLIRQRMAEARAQGVTWSELAADVDPGYEDPQGLLGTPHACHVALINYLGLLQLFEMLCQVCCPASLLCCNPLQLQPQHTSERWMGSQAHCRVPDIAPRTAVCPAGPGAGLCQVWAG